MSTHQYTAARFTAWAAIFGGVLAYTNVFLVLMATGGDTEAILHGARMLALPATSHDLFRWGMCADILGFYLPVLVIGCYLWHRYREHTGVMGDAALMAIVLYTVVGVGGASLQLAALSPLAQAYADGSDAVKVAADTTWTAIAHASQKGLWWSEGPVVLFWGLVVGDQLGKEEWARPRLFLLKTTGWCFGLFFVVGMFPALGSAMRALLVVVVLIFPLWMLSFGAQLLRHARYRSAADMNGSRAGERH